MKQRLITSLAIFAASYGLAGCTKSVFLSTTEMPDAGCLSQARQVLYDADFSENLKIIPAAGAVSGRHGGYDATIYCPVGGRPVRVDIRGLDPDQIDWYRKQIIDKF